MWKDVLTMLSEDKDDSVWSLDDEFFRSSKLGQFIDISDLEFDSLLEMDIFPPEANLMQEIMTTDLKNDEVDLESTSTNISQKPGESSSVSSFNFNKGTKRKRVEWKQGVPDLVSGPEFFPDAIVDIIKCDRRGPVVIANARKHLLYLGWKIECRENQVRYISPEDKPFYSLRKICQMLGNDSHELGSSISSKYDKNCLVSVPKDIEKSSKSAQMIGNDTQELGSSISSKYDKNCLVSLPKDIEKSTKLPTTPDLAVIEPEYCPEAVKEYYDHYLVQKNNGCITKAAKAKKHLSAIGWSFYYQSKKGKKKEMRYRAPFGKCFHSLVQACKWCIEVGSLSTFSETQTLGGIEVVSELQEKQTLGGIKVVSEPQEKGYDVA